MLLLVDHDQIDVVAAAQAMVGDRQQAVRVGRQVDSRHDAALGQQSVDEAGALMAEAVVIVAPAGRSEQVVQRRNRTPPRQLGLAGLQPLRVLRRHRVDDHRERLVRREHAVASGERVALEPALMAMLAQHFHHAAVGRDVIVVALDAAHQASVLDLEHVAEAIRVGLVGTEEAKVLLLGVARENIAQHFAEGARRFDLDAAGLFERHRVFGERRDIERDGQESAVGVRIRAHPASSLRRNRFDLRLQRVRARRTTRRAGNCASTASSNFRCSGFSFTLSSGT